MTFLLCSSQHVKKITKHRAISEFFETSKTAITKTRSENNQCWRSAIAIFILFLLAISSRKKKQIKKHPSAIFGIYSENYLPDDINVVKTISYISPHSTSTLRHPCEVTANFLNNLQVLDFIMITVLHKFGT